MLSSSGWFFSWLKSPQKVLFLMLILIIAACSERHRGVMSFEEAYVANKANDFEFSHFKFFGSEHVLIMYENSKKNRQTYSGLCELHGMNCQKVYLDLNSENIKKDLLKAMEIVHGFNGEYFLVVSENKDLKALLVAQYAREKYNKTDKDLVRMLKQFKPSRLESLYEILNLSVSTDTTLNSDSN